MNDSKARAKQLVGDKVASWVTSGMILGIGTGSTASCAIQAIGRRIRDESLVVSGIPTSFASERLARQVGIQLTTFDEVESLDLAFDGADEVDPDMNLIKGRGAAQTREKIVASRSERFVVLVDESKMVNRLGGKMPLPVEVVPLAAAPVIRLLTSLGARAEIRMGQKKDGPVVSDQGLWIVDAFFDSISDLEGLDRTLLNTAGILDHGLFLRMTTDVLIGRNDGTISHLKK